jgi:hypothetical protein
MDLLQPGAREQESYEDTFEGVMVILRRGIPYGSHCLVKKGNFVAQGN